MDLNNGIQVNHQKKVLILEARHSKVIEDAKHMRSKLPSKLFIARPKKPSTTPQKLMESKKILMKIRESSTRACTLPYDTNSDCDLNEHKKRKLDKTTIFVKDIPKPKFRILSAKKWWINNKAEIPKKSENKNYSNNKTDEKHLKFEIYEEVMLSNQGREDLLTMLGLDKAKQYNDKPEIPKISESISNFKNNKDKHLETYSAYSQHSIESSVGIRGNNKTPAKTSYDAMAISEVGDKTTTSEPPYYLRSMENKNSDKTINVSREVIDTTNRNDSQIADKIDLKLADKNEISEILKYLNTTSQPTNSQYSIESSVDIGRKNKMPAKTTHDAMAISEAADKTTTSEPPYYLRSMENENSDKTLNVSREVIDTTNRNESQIFNNEDCLNYKKFTQASVEAFWNIVRNSLTASNRYNASALCDTEIYDNVKNFEKSVNDFSHFLLQNYQEMDETRKTNELYCFNYCQRRLQNSTKSCDLSIRKSGNLEAVAEEFVVKITAPEIPEQTLTFKTSQMKKTTNLLSDSTLEIEFPEDDCFSKELAAENNNCVTEETYRMSLLEYQSHSNMQSSTILSFTAQQTSLENHRTHDRFEHNTHIPTTTIHYRPLPDYNLGSSLVTNIENLLPGSNLQNYIDTYIEKSIRENPFPSTLNGGNKTLNYNEQIMSETIDNRVMLDENYSTYNMNPITASQTLTQSFNCSTSNLQLHNNVNANFNSAMHKIHQHPETSRESQRADKHSRHKSIVKTAHNLTPSHPYQPENHFRIHTYSTNLKEVRPGFIELDINPYDLRSPAVNSNYPQRQQNPAIIEQMSTTHNFGTLALDYNRNFGPRTQLTNLGNSLEPTPINLMSSLYSSPFPTHNLKISSFPLTPPADGKMNYP